MPKKRRIVKPAHAPKSSSGRNRVDDGLVPSALVAVDRAAHDLRRGLAVVVVNRSRGKVVVAFATELVTGAKIDALGRWARAMPDVVLTHPRAETLKIRRYTPEVVRIPLPDWLGESEIRSLADPAADLANPMRGPFNARREPVPTAIVAAVKLAKIARLLPSIIAAAVPAQPGPGFARTRPRLAAVEASAVLGYDAAAAGALRQVTSARVPLAAAENARILAFRPSDGGPEHLAIVIGEPARTQPVLARLHSECFTGDLLGSLKCDCGQQLRGAIAEIAAAGGGVVLYLAQEGRGIGLINKLRAYALQDQGFDTFEANARLGFDADERLFLPAAEMLRQLGYLRVRLMTNNPDKVEALRGFGIEVVDRVPHRFPTNEHNAFYLSAKKTKAGHLL
jgi:GTP cyclohydrolase II